MGRKKRGRKLRAATRRARAADRLNAQTLDYLDVHMRIAGRLFGGAIFDGWHEAPRRPTVVDAEVLHMRPFDEEPRLPATSCDAKTTDKRGAE
jgi:hypothetical protein